LEYIQPHHGTNCGQETVNSSPHVASLQSIWASNRTLTTRPEYLWTTQLNLYDRRVICGSYSRRQLHGVEQKRVEIRILEIFIWYQWYRRLGWSQNQSSSASRISLKFENLLWLWLRHATLTLDRQAVQSGLGKKWVRTWEARSTLVSARFYWTKFPPHTIVSSNPLPFTPFDWNKNRTCLFKVIQLNRFRSFRNRMPLWHFNTKCWRYIHCHTKSWYRLPKQ
jgi:hypothetical protein